MTAIFWFLVNWGWVFLLVGVILHGIYREGLEDDDEKSAFLVFARLGRLGRWWATQRLRHRGVIPDTAKVGKIQFGPLPEADE